MSSNNAKTEDTGLDRFDWQPDYSKSKEENEKDFREQFFKFYGEYPDESKDSQSQS